MIGQKSYLCLDPHFTKRDVRADVYKRESGLVLLDLCDLLFVVRFNRFGYETEPCAERPIRRLQQTV